MADDDRGDMGPRAESAPQTPYLTRGWTVKLERQLRAAAAAGGAALVHGALRGAERLLEPAPQAARRLAGGPLAGAEGPSTRRARGGARDRGARKAAISSSTQKAMIPAISTSPLLTRARAISYRSRAPTVPIGRVDARRAAHHAAQHQPVAAREPRVDRAGPADHAAEPQRAARRTAGTRRPRDRTRSTPTTRWRARTVGAERLQRSVQE